MYCYQKESPEPVAQETKEEEVRTFTYFNNYLFMLGQLSLKIESLPMHCGKILNQMNSFCHMAFIIWRGQATALPLKSLPLNLL